MAEEAQRTSGIFLPYPLLGLIMTLVLALSGGIIGLYTQLSAMQTTLLLRDSDYQRQQKQAWEKIEQLQIYIQNDREQIAALKAQIEKRRN